MYDVNSICFLCLNGNTRLKTVSDNDTATQVKYVLPELIISDPVRICSLCCSSVQTFYTFKKTCLDNYSRLMNTTNTIQATSDTQGQKSTELQIKIYNCEPLVKQELDLDIEENIEDNEDLSLLQAKQVEDNIEINDDLIAVTDIAEQECHQQLEFVKCEVESDSEQKDAPSITNINNNPLDNEDIVTYAVSNELLVNSDKIHKGVKKFICVICNNKFTEKGNLQKHMRIHTGVKEFECNICTKRFTLKGHLKRHIKTHTGDKDFECGLCNKRFTQNISLKMHIKTHLGGKDFECSVCNKRFILKSYLQKHMRFHEGIKNFECSSCNKKFTLKCHLQAHRNSRSCAKEFAKLSPLFR